MPSLLNHPASFGIKESISVFPLLFVCVCVGGKAARDQDKNEEM